MQGGTNAIGVSADLNGTSLCKCHCGRPPELAQRLELALRDAQIEHVGQSVIDGQQLVDERDRFG